MSDGIPMPAKPAKVYAVPARPGLVNDMREWELIGTTTWMPDTIAEQIDEALDGYRRAQDAHTQTWSFGTIPAAPWLTPDARLQSPRQCPISRSNHPLQRRTRADIPRPPPAAIPANRIPPRRPITKQQAR